MSLFSKLEDTIRQRMEEEGIDEDVIQRVLGESPEPRKGPRFLKSNTAPVESKSKTSIPSKEIVVCLNYGKRSHVLFGDFRQYADFKDDFLKKQTYIKANGRLAFGFGWVIMDKTKLKEVVSALKKAKIPFRKIERVDYEKEVNGEETEDEPPSPKKNDDEKSPSPKPSPKKTTTKLKTKKNDWGNREEDNTGFIFDLLPVGKDGKKSAVVIGWQNPSHPKDGNKYESIYPLDEECFATCKEKRWKYLTDEMVKTVKKHNKKLAGHLGNILTRDIESDDDEFSSDSDEE